MPESVFDLPRRWFAGISGTSALGENAECIVRWVAESRPFLGWVNQGQVPTGVHLAGSGVLSLSRGRALRMCGIVIQIMTRPTRRDELDVRNREGEEERRRGRRWGGYCKM